LSGPALRRPGGDGRITSGDHRVAQRWAWALWRRPEAVEGLYWRSRFDDSRFNVALFDRAEDALAPAVVGTWDAPAQRALALLASILNTYDFGLI
jgi:hypothetical protein